MVTSVDVQVVCCWLLQTDENWEYLWCFSFQLLWCVPQCYSCHSIYYEEIRTVIWGCPGTVGTDTDSPFWTACSVPWLVFVLFFFGIGLREYKWLIVLQRNCDGHHLTVWHLSFVSYLNGIVDNSVQTFCVPYCSSPCSVLLFILFMCTLLLLTLFSPPLYPFPVFMSFCPHAIFTIPLAVSL
jgi:hypothetical protein